MGGYLAGYGAGEERRSKLVKRAVIGLISVLVGVTVAYFGLRNQSARSRMDQFIELLQKKDYKAAHALWGCTDQTPCRDYNMERFLRDWGPDSPAANPASARIERSATCGGILVNTGVLRVYHFDPDYSVSLYVEKSDGNVSFAPMIGRMQCTVLP